MKYLRQFLMSFVAGVGSALGAYITKECADTVKKEYKRRGDKKQAESINN